MPRAIPRRQQPQNDSFSLELRAVQPGRTENGVQHLSLQTDAGDIVARFHPAPAGNAAVVWVGGAGGGLDGPAGGLYPRLAGQLVTDNVASLRLHYRRPNDLPACVLDTLLGIAYLGSEHGRTRVVLAGHSFGGAVVITAGAIDDAVVGVAALSSQTYGTESVSALSPKPLLLQHGTADEILPDACSRDLFRRAGEPKQIFLYPGCGHGLDACRNDVDRDLLAWIRQTVAVAHT